MQGLDSGDRKEPLGVALDKPLTSSDLIRLDVAALVRYGNQALQAGQYRRAASLLREGVKRAPFRQDIKEALAAAIEGVATLRDQPEPQDAAPRIQEIRPRESEPIPIRPIHHDEDEPQYPRHQQNRSARIEEFDVPAEPPRRQTSSPERQPRFSAERLPERVAPVSQPDSSGGRPIAFGRRPGAGAHRTEPARRPKPAQFTRRHNRGPISALLLTLVVLLAFMAVAAAGIYYYTNRATTPDSEADAPAQNYEAKYEKAANLKMQRRFSEAVEVLMTIDPTMRRDRTLAEIYREQAQISIDAKPPVLESAIESLTEAVKFDPQNPDYGILLGDMYYTLGRKYQQSDPATGRSNLDKARQRYQAVLKDNPGNLKALLSLGDTAGALGDAVTQAECYQSIKRIDPNSPEAAAANRYLKSLGYRQ